MAQKVVGPDVDGHVGHAVVPYELERGIELAGANQGAAGLSRDSGVEQAELATIPKLELVVEARDVAIEGIGDADVGGKGVAEGDVEDGAVGVGVLPGGASR